MIGATLGWMRLDLLQSLSFDQQSRGWNEDMSTRIDQPQVPCPKCGGRMQEGFILDRGHYDSKRASEWVEGEPVRSFWHGGLKVSDKAQYEVTTYRCGGCGYLESYAETARE